MTQTSTDLTTGRNGCTYRTDPDGNPDGMPMDLLFNYEFTDQDGDRNCYAVRASCKVEAECHALRRWRGSGFDPASLVVDPDWTHIIFRGTAIDRADMDRLAAEREAEEVVDASDYDTGLSRQVRWA